jgi:transcription elongation factor GreB
VERPQVTLAVQAAAAQGDRSENAEYTYGKRRLREIDQRVRHLRQRLEGMTIVDQPPSDPRRVFFGARVTLETDGGEQRCYRRRPDELTPPLTISMDATGARIARAPPRRRGGGRARRRTRDLHDRGDRLPG